MSVFKAIKCTKIYFGWGSLYSAPPDPLLDLRGPTSNGRGYRKGEEGGEGGEEREGKEGRGGDPRVYL